MTSLTSGGWKRDDPVKVNGLHRFITKDAIEFWARIVSGSAYKLLEEAEKRDWVTTLTTDDIIEAYQKITSNREFPTALPVDVRDPILSHAWENEETTTESDEAQD